MGWVLVLFAGVVGVLIGMVGVGGVLLPPALIAAGGMSVSAATATSTWAFLFTGVVGTVAYAWRGVIPWRMLLHLAVGIVPAAFLGARANAVLPAAVVLLAMAVLTLFVGIHQLLHKESPGRGRELGIAHSVALGAVVGFGSALTGTGGPLMLVPALLVLGVVPLKAVAVSQAAQLPLVASGSIGYLQAGLTDISLGTLLGIVAATGTITGALIATQLSPQRVRQVVALACIAAGAFLLVRTVVAFR